MGRKAIDLTGKQFGNWLVIKRDENKTNSVYWICECQCEYKTLKSIRSNHLSELNKNKIISKCNKCKQKDIIQKNIDKKALLETNKKIKYSKLIGCQFGNLIVKDFYGHNKNKQLM